MTSRDTCDGHTCFVRRVGSVGNEHDQSAIDRDCFTQADLFLGAIALLCNSSEGHIRGTVITRYMCCNDSDLCNENLTVPYIYPSMTPTPTSGKGLASHFIL